MFLSFSGFFSSLLLYFPSLMSLIKVRYKMRYGNKSRVMSLAQWNRRGGGCSGDVRYLSQWEGKNSKPETTASLNRRLSCGWNVIEINGTLNCSLQAAEAGAVAMWQEEGHNLEAAGGEMSLFLAHPYTENSLQVWKNQGGSSSLCNCPGCQFSTCRQDEKRSCIKKEQVYSLEW